MEEQRLSWSLRHHGDSVHGAEAFALDPAEILMRIEDGFHESPLAGVVDAQRAWLRFCFADGARHWRKVWARLLATLEELVPELLPDPVPDDFPSSSDHALAVKCLAEDVDAVLPQFKTLMGFYLGDNIRAGRYRAAVGSLYLLARHYMPFLIEGDLGRRVDFERIAGVMEEIPLAPNSKDHSWIPPGMDAAEWRKMCGNARSRWSARAQVLLARPIQQATGRPGPSLFGEKSATVREKYRLAALGNQHRLDKRKPQNRGSGGAALDTVREA